MKPLPPAIPRTPDMLPDGWWYVPFPIADVFTERKLDLLAPPRGHFFKAPLPDQISLWEGCENG